MKLTRRRNANDFARIVTEMQRCCERHGARFQLVTFGDIVLECPSTSAQSPMT